MDTDDFKKEIEDLRHLGFDPYPERVRLNIPDARKALEGGLRYYLGDFQWLPCYDEIAAWLTDNKGRGLLCVGNCGLGKTLICANILPVIIHNRMRKVVKSYGALDINDRIEEVKHCKLSVIDDIGTEPEAVIYGERHMAFPEIVDNAEKRGNLLIITTNLRTNTPPGQGADYPSIQSRYGNRTLDRLKAITKVVRFDGKSFRR